jgi:RNA polymerase sigma-70 factor, ECF subfamily
LDSAETTDFAALLLAYRRGDAEAASRLFALVYQDLRRLAGAYLSAERAGHTLQATALVHEAYLRLLGEGAVEFESRAHFFVIAARQMRRILIDYARAARAGKRGGWAVKSPLEAAAGERVMPREDLLALDEALRQLAALDARAATVVELRFFAGLTEREAAEILQVSVASLRRDWAFAKVWLHERLYGAGSGNGAADAEED